MEIPPIKLWTYELALIKAYKEPIHNNLEVISEEEKSSAKTISSIREIKG